MRANSQPSGAGEWGATCSAFFPLESPPLRRGSSQTVFPKLAAEPHAEEVRAPAESDEPALGSSSPWYPPVKTVVEWAAALVLLVLTAPLVLLMALLVKATSAGPAFYLQTRVGRHGRLFRIIKIRTMTHNCEALTGPVWAAQNDTRSTGVGRVLRATHLDELPQLCNVLRGQMSLIGPRPERPEITERIELHVPGFRRRLNVRPGVTGLAQMRLPADSDLAGVRLKVAHDLYYIRWMNPWLDLRIAACTFFYFMGAAADALRRMLVKGYGRAVEEALNAPATREERDLHAGTA